MKATIQVKADQRVKTEAAAVLSGLGMKTSQAVNMFLRQVVFQQGIPFAVTTRVPNAATIAALAAAIEWRVMPTGMPLARAIAVMVEDRREENRDRCQSTAHANRITPKRGRSWRQQPGRGGRWEARAGRGGARYQQLAWGQRHWFG